MARSATLLARSILEGGPGSLEELRVHEFADDEAAHDDDRIEELYVDFASDFERVVLELSEPNGQPSRTGEADQVFIPLNGLFRFAAWDVGELTLFVADAHEDRGIPIVLMLGTADGESA